MINYYVTATEQVNKTGEIEIEIQKSIDFPKRPKFIPLPFIRTSIDWKLSLRNSRNEIPLVDYLLLWY